MARLLVVYYSMTGGTQAMAEAAANGAREECDTVLQRAEDTDAEDLLSADGFIFAAPENLAAIAGVMKAFYDRTYYAVLGKIEGRPYAQLVCAGSDGANAVKQTARIATGWRLKQAQEPIIVCTHAQTKEQILAPKKIAPGNLATCRALGQAMGAGLALGVF